MSKRRVVDRFKLRLRDALETAIKRKGGVSHAIIRDAFLDWDADASGKLDPHELVRTMPTLSPTRQTPASTTYHVVSDLLYCFVELLRTRASTPPNALPSVLLGSSNGTRLEPSRR